jgi:hypothetical protein
MHFDEANGNIPLLIFPDESIKHNEKIINFLKAHPIWFLDLEEQRNSEPTSIIHEDNIYLAKKFRMLSEIDKKYSDPITKSFNMVTVIIALPKELESDGLNFLNIIVERICKDLKEELYQIIESEILKEKNVLTIKMREIIERGELLKDQIIKQIQTIQKDYFSTILSLQLKYCLWEKTP